MKEDGVEVEKIIEKAEKSLVEAEKNFDIGNFETTISLLPSYLRKDFLFRNIQELYPDSISIL
jgi:hypothetical protein